MARMSTTESGFSVLAPGSNLLRTVNVPDGVGAPTHLSLRWGTPAFLLGHFALGFDRTVEDLNGPVMDDWAYAYRAVRGYNASWSDHSGGIAIDLNATQHPLGRLTFTAEETRQVQKMLDRYDGALYGGLNYHNRKDEMHFGLQGTYAHAEKVARYLLDTPRGKIICAANPGLRAYVLS